MDDLTFLKYVVAFTYGNGCLAKLKDHKNVRFHATQLSKNRDYIEWRGDIFSHLTRVQYSETSDMITTDTLDHPVYTKVYNRLYHSGRKTFDPHYLKLFDWETLAILYQDNGNWRFRPQCKSKTPEVYLATHTFTYAENLMLRRVLKERLGLEWNTQHQRYKDMVSYYYLSLRTKDYEAFEDGVRSFIKPSFTYKLDIPFDKPLLEEPEGDDIVLISQETVSADRNDSALITI
jgi:hypothetical protein